MTTHAARPTSPFRGPTSTAPASIRSRAAAIRSLVDELERQSSLLPADEVRVQVAEELRRLGLRCLEHACDLLAVED